MAAVNPCGFPLLPAYLAGFVASESNRGWASRTARALAAGACVTAGFVLTFGLAGVLVSSGVALIAGWIPWVMLGVGGGLTALGIAGLFGKHPRIQLPSVRFRIGRGITAMAGFGVAYAVGSLSCTLPLFLASVAGSFTTTGFFNGLLTFIAYGLGMGVFVIAASVVAAQLGAGSLRALRPLTRFVPVLASLLVTAAGLYLAYYWVVELIDPLAVSPVTSAVGVLQTAVSGRLASSPIAVATALVLILAALAALTWRRLRRGIDRKENTKDA